MLPKYCLHEYKIKGGDGKKERRHRANAILVFMYRYDEVNQLSSGELHKWCT